MIGSGIVPKVLPLDLFLEKIMKEFHRDLHNDYMLNVPENPTASYTFITSH